MIIMLGCVIKLCNYNQNDYNYNQNVNELGCAIKFFIRQCNVNVKLN